MCIVGFSCVCSKEVNCFNIVAVFLMQSNILTCPLSLRLGCLMMMLLDLLHFTEFLLFFPFLALEFQSVFFQLDFAFLQCDLTHFGFMQSFVEELEIARNTSSIPCMRLIYFCATALHTTHKAKMKQHTFYCTYFCRVACAPPESCQGQLVHQYLCLCWLPLHHCHHFLPQQVGLAPYMV